MSDSAFAQKIQSVVCLFVCSLSSSVLQGFTCLGVSTLKRSQVKRLIQACRRRGSTKVPLVETQVWGKDFS